MGPSPKGPSRNSVRTLADGGRATLGRRRRLAVFLACASCVAAADQASKATVRAVAPGPGWFGTLVPGLFDLVRVENAGAAFGMGRGAGPLFVIVAAAVVVASLALVLREELPLPLVISLACVAGGGVGNLVDRVAYGSVTDFIATTFVAFPVFNVADIFVTCGIVASVVAYLRWEAGPRALS